ncbi:hypothetical protein [Streptomyces sp. NBC_00872]|uniref:hypothetical protein n=1 Tax=Streptomyces sp. NBC_00872 TaxID=2903686 RepID=UPI00386BED26|nr:hypothetical protein OG214_37735 [Streptomyces sp. NBC_00872]
MLEHPDPVDMAFDDTGVPEEGQAGDDGFAVAVALGSVCEPVAGGGIPALVSRCNCRAPPGRRPPDHGTGRNQCVYTAFTS